jgi:hypothetical protein
MCEKTLKEWMNSILGYPPRRIVFWDTIYEQACPAQTGINE